MKTLLCALVVAAVTLVATAQSVSRRPRPDRLCGPSCYIFCEYGNVLDARGCPTCQCNEQPFQCPQVLCARPCPGGYITTDRGCQTCQCKPNRLCGPVCLIFCEYGNVLDARGCPTCQCNERPLRPVCRPRQCRIRCRYGNVQDFNGCDLCRCKPRPGCRLENGTLLTDKRPGDSFQLDPCTRCNCNSRGDVTCSAVACGWPICDNPPVFVKGQCCPSCPEGKAFKAHVCTLCDCGADGNVFCSVRDFARPPCDNTVSVKDRCCPVCPTVPVRPVCGRRPLCRIGCPNGFVTDRDGCAICRCRPVTVPTSCRRQCRIYCDRADFSRRVGRRNEPTGCDCNCPFRPRYPTIYRN